MSESGTRSVLSVYPDADTKKWVEDTAAADGRSANNWVLNLIRKEREKRGQ